MKSLLAILLLCVAVASASGPGIPPNTKALEEAFVVADIIVIGTPTKVVQRHFHKGKKVSEEEGRRIYDAYDSETGEPFPRLVTEFTVTLKVSSHLKGALQNSELVFQWRDLTGSMCPHIPLIALREKGIWYTGKHVKESEHDHAVYWASLDSKKKVEASSE